MLEERHEHYHLNRVLRRDLLTGGWLPVEQRLRTKEPPMVDDGLDLLLCYHALHPHRGRCWGIGPRHCFDAWRFGSKVDQGFATHKIVQQLKQWWCGSSGGACARGMRNVAAQPRVRECSGEVLNEL